MTATASHVLSEGTLVAERYRVQRELGRGGMGCVYEAHDERLGQSVALKVSHPTGPGAEGFRARFKREAELAGRLGRVEGIVRALDQGDLPGGAMFLVMDLVEGARPLDLLTGSREERLRRVRIAAQLVDAIHRRGVVHRDLKPGNLLQTADGQIHLTDFGLAKRVGQDAAAFDVTSPGTALTQMGTGMGTPQYMPPEQFEDAANVDARADIYALGCMLFQALVGRLPFPGGTFQTVWIAQQRCLEGKSEAPRPRAIDPTVPEELDGLCAAALALDQSLRLSSASHLVAGIDRVLGDAFSTPLESRATLGGSLGDAATLDGPDAPTRARRPSQAPAAPDPNRPTAGQGGNRSTGRATPSSHPLQQSGPGSGPATPGSGPAFDPTVQGSGSGSGARAAGSSSGARSSATVSDGSNGGMTERGMAGTLPPRPSSKLRASGASAAAGSFAEAQAQVPPTGTPPRAGAGLAPLLAAVVLAGGVVGGIVWLRAVRAAAVASRQPLPTTSSPPPPVATDAATATAPPAGTGTGPATEVAVVVPPRVELTLDAPASGALVGARARVAGRVALVGDAGSGPTTLLVAGQPVSLGEGGAFAAEVDVGTLAGTTGQATLVLEASAAGVTERREVVVRVDVAPPTLELLAPLPRRARTSADRATVRLRVSDAGPVDVRLRVAGAVVHEQHLEGPDEVLKVIELPPGAGKTLVEVEAVDALGLRATTQVEVERARFEAQVDVLVRGPSNGPVQQLVDEAALAPGSAVHVVVSTLEGCHLYLFRVEGVGVRAWVGGSPRSRRSRVQPSLAVHLPNVGWDVPKGPGEVVVVLSRAEVPILEALAQAAREGSAPRGKLDAFLSSRERAIAPTSADTEVPLVLRGVSGLFAHRRAVDDDVLVWRVRWR